MAERWVIIHEHGHGTDAYLFEIEDYSQFSEFEELLECAIAQIGINYEPMKGETIHMDSMRGLEENVHTVVPKEKSLAGGWEMGELVQGEQNV